MEIWEVHRHVKLSCRRLEFASHHRLAINVILKINCDKISNLYIVDIDKKLIVTQGFAESSKINAVWQSNIMFTQM